MHTLSVAPSNEMLLSQQPGVEASDLSNRSEPIVNDSTPVLCTGTSALSHIRWPQFVIHGHHATELSLHYKADQCNAQPLYADTSAVTKAASVSADYVKSNPFAGLAKNCHSTPSLNLSFAEDAPLAM